jgi:hypothetical protein
MAPDMHAPAEYLKQPGVFATTETARSDPPMMAPLGWNGEFGPKSTTNPMFLPVLFHWTVVPTLTQTRELPLAPGIEGVAEAALAVRFTSISHGADVEPQVFAATHSSSGFASVQA